VTGSQSRFDGKRSLGLFTGLSIAVGQHSTAGVSIEHQDGKTVAATDVHRSLPLGEGFGYRLRAEGGESALVDGDLQYQTRFGRYEVLQQHVEGQAVTTLNAAGSIVGIGGRLFASRPVEQSFALVRVPGVSHVRAFMSNQEVGETDGHGNLLVPNLLPYYGNHLSIADVDVPLDLSIGTSEMTLAPPYRGGAVALFPVSRDQRLTGRVRITRNGETLGPTSGRLRVTVDGRAFESPLGRAGEFYLEGVPAGSYVATIDEESGTCTFTLRVPNATAPVMQLGTLECTAH
jgi:outer membrane usher protein